MAKQSLKRPKLYGSLSAALLLCRSTLLAVPPESHQELPPAVAARTLAPAFPGAIVRWGGAKKAPAAADGLSLHSGFFRPDRGLAPEFAGPTAALGRPAAIAYVLFDCPVQQPLLDQLTELGATVIDALPPNAATIKATPDVLAAVSRNPCVLSVFRLPTARKVMPSLTARAANQETNEVETAVFLHEPDVDGRMSRRLATLGFRSTAYYPQVRAFTGHFVPGRALVVAGEEEVSFIEETLPVGPALSTSVGYCEATDIRADASHYGAGITVGVMDSGFMISHDAFGSQDGYPSLSYQGRNVSSAPGGDIATFIDPQGHGTHVLSTLLGRWSSHSPRLDGVAPWIAGDTAHAVRLIRCSNDSKVWSGTDQGINILAGDAAVQVINNSWGGGTNTGASLDSVLVDQAVWGSGQLWIFAAGNNGPNAGTVLSPGAAKNVLTVGNLENSYKPLVRVSSSMGPTADGRFKPEIYAPGTLIRAAYTNGVAGSELLTGTSMATPHVSGVAATLLDHHPVLRGRPALAKALLTASAQRLPGITGNAQAGGLKAGRVHSERAHWATGGSTYFIGHADSGVSHQATQSWDFTIPAGYEKMYVVLTWIEPSAPAINLNRCYNDVDLQVDRGADGSDEWTSTTPSDNYEFVSVDNPAAGLYRFKALGYAVTSLNKLGLCVFLEKDADAPRPSPTAWQVAPFLDGTGITMTAAAAEDLVNGVEYFFDETSGNPGGSDAGWQSSSGYTDTGLHDGYTYTYRVKARDTSALHNETSDSPALSAATSPRLLSSNDPQVQTKVPNRYSFSVPALRWTAVGLAASSDHDLKVDDDVGFGAPLAASTMSGTSREFVAINGHLVSGTRYAELYYGNQDTYRIEAESSASSITYGSSVSGTLGSGEVFDLYQVALTNGQQTALTVDVTGNADVSLFVLPPSMSYVSRSTAAFSSDFAGAGGDESITFTANASGTYGLLVVNENLGYVEYNLSVMTPAGPVLSVTPAALSFGTVLAGSSADLAFTVRNDGAGTLSGSATVSAPFSIVSGGSYSLGANATQVVTVRFSPVSTGSFTQPVAFSGGGGASRTAAGTGGSTTAPAISVSPNSLNFGSVMVGYSADMSLTVRNAGTGTLSGNASATAPFSVVSGGSYSLGANATQTVTVRFTPPTAASAAQTMTFTGGGGAGAALSGTGYSGPSPIITVTPNQLDFSSVAVGSYADLSFTVLNTGAGTLSGSAAVGPPFSVVSGGSYTLGQSMGQTVVIRYQPGSSGSHNESATFSGGNTATRTVLGSAYIAPAPAITVTPSSYNVGWVQVGSYAEVSFLLQNSGGGTLTGNAAARAPFHISAGGFYALSAGQTQWLYVRFIPTQAGFFYDNVSLSGVSYSPPAVVAGRAYDDTSDADLDGMADCAEIKAGTDPLNTNSLFSIRGLAISNGTIAIRWQSVPAKSYRVSRLANLTAGAAVSITNGVISQGSTTTVVDRPDAGPGPFFYRVEVEY